MFAKSLHRVAFSIGAASLLVPAAAIPANAAATEGMKTIESSWCVPVPEAGLTMCSTATERNLEVHTPTGRALVRTVGSSTTTTTYGDGSVETSSDAHQVLSVFSFWLDPLVYETTMVSIDAMSTRTLPDGTVCTFVEDSVAVHRELVRGGITVTCTTPSNG